MMRSHCWCLLLYWLASGSLPGWADANGTPADPPHLVAGQLLADGEASPVAAVESTTAAGADPLTGTWKPVGDRILTRWGAAVSPTNVWPEYPRPDFRRDRWLNLNGLWDYALLPLQAPQPQTYQGEVLVPFCMESALSGVGTKVTPDQRIWYRRTFAVPDAWADEKVLLHFGGVDYETHLFVNGALVGSHTGGHDRFFFDITDYLQPGENELVVAVYDPTCQGENPAGKQRHAHQGIWYSPVSGIWQTVWLEPVSAELSLEELRVTPDIDRETLAIETHTDVALPGNMYGVRLSVAAQGRKVASTLAPINDEVVLSIPSPRLWSPHDPFLYTLTLELYRLEPAEPSANATSEGPARPLFAERRTVGQPLDSVTSYVGMRKIALGPGHDGQPVMMLNNKPLFQNGVLDQGWWPGGLYTPPSEAALEFEMQYLKDAGFNLIRKHVKVEPACYYYLADKLGLLIWQDMPSTGSRPTGGPTAQFAGRNSTRDIRKKGTSAAQFEYEYRRILSMLYNHPSIVSWVTFNEGWGQYDTGRLTDYVRGLDNTRLVNSVSGWVLLDYGDVYDIHTYEEIPRTPERMSDRAIVLGEYGGMKCLVNGHTWRPMVSDGPAQGALDQLAERYRRKFAEVVRQHREVGLSAAVYTQTSDIQGELNGLLTYDRKVIKIPAEVLREIHQPVLDDNSGGQDSSPPSSRD
jgi:hypothetical protein